LRSRRYSEAVRVGEIVHVEVMLGVTFVGIDVCVAVPVEVEVRVGLAVGEGV
jgi:hypothetical protein